MDVCRQEVDGEEREMVQKESVAELVSRLVQGTTYEMLDAAEAIGRTGE